MPELIKQFAARIRNGFVAGWIASFRNRHLQVADDITQGGLSGVVFSSEVGVSTRLTQGASLLGKTHQITEGERNLISMTDG